MLSYQGEALCSKCDETFDILSDDLTVQAGKHAEAEGHAVGINIIIAAHPKPANPRIGTLIDLTNTVSKEN